MDWVTTGVRENSHVAAKRRLPFQVFAPHGLAPAFSPSTFHGYNQTIPPKSGADGHAPRDAIPFNDSYSGDNLVAAGHAHRAARQTAGRT